MALAIEVVDAQNGGDVDVLVSGINAGATVQVYRQSFEDGSSWVAFGSPTSSDPTETVSDTVQPGYYWWHAIEDNGGVLSLSNMVKQVVRSASQPVLKQIIDAVVTRLQDAADANALPNILSTNIKACYEYSPGAALVNYPGILVMSTDKKVALGGLDTLDDFAYPVVILALDTGNNLKPVEADDPYYRWHETIEKLFIMNRMNEVERSNEPVVYKLDFTYPKTIEFLMNNYQHIRVGLQLNVTTREDRSP